LNVGVLLGIINFIVIVELKEIIVAIIVAKIFGENVSLYASLRYESSCML
jgi:hypothetical protein